MYNVNRTFIFKNLYQNIYITKKNGTKEDYYHNEIPTYDKPELYRKWNIQFVKAESEILEFGENVSNMKVAVIPNNAFYANKFSEFDLAYLDGATPNGEAINGQNANYRIYSVRPQNSIIKIYFLKLTK